MLVLKLTQVKARASRIYTQNTTGWLPARMAWLDPRAARDFERMNEACGHRIEYTDVYRSTLTQILAIRQATRAKKRLYAPPTKSGHNFGLSVDIGVEATLENFRKSGQADLVVASRDRPALGRWMAGFGWTGIDSEDWHFNHLDGAASAVKKIDAEYGERLRLSNVDVQRAINRLLKLDKPLVEDGQLGPVTASAAKAAVAQLDCGGEENGDFGPWFRRLLAGATVTVEEVPRVE